MLISLLKKIIGSLSDEDKRALKAFIEEMLKAAASGAVQGAMKQ